MSAGGRLPAVSGAAEEDQLPHPAVSVCTEEVDTHTSRVGIAFVPDMYLGRSLRRGTKTEVCKGPSYPSKIESRRCEWSGVAYRKEISVNGSPKSRSNHPRLRMTVYRSMSLHYT